MPAPKPALSLPNRLASIVGAAHVLTGAENMARYVAEPRGYYQGNALAVVRPGSAAEVAAILRLANETLTPIVPQGGNTGLVGGQTPDESGREVVLSLERMDAIRGVDAAGATLVAEAGAILANVQDAAAEAGMLFPLSLGAEGSCRIGGNISTNAGGVAVLAYGNTRNLVMGMEVVLPTGEIWNGMRGLRKDNSGYDLKQLFIGGEGTLGIVTAAVLKLFPRPRGKAVAFIASAGAQETLGVLKLARDRAGGGLTAFEVIPRLGVQMVLDHMPGARDPFETLYPCYALLEFSSGVSEADAGATAEAALADGLAEGLVLDATIAASLDQANALWRIRHGLVEVQKCEGGSIKHDVSVAVEDVPAFIERASAAVLAVMADARPLPFGHLGDGNIHFNISQPRGMDTAAFRARAPEIHAAVYGVVAAFDGSIAAEHGIGRYKRALLATVKSDIELDMMRRIKRVFDPNNILNPGRVL
jgi:FAD/FMN-containing dehydrogenase